uniref:Cadherin domain-containing protein n=1 Tax=Panagrellus redivivus TaxID=6233 RepID=A0A7E4ZW99_PANRE
MNCFPNCEVPLPRIGTTLIKSALDACKSPAVLTLTVTSDGRRSQSLFTAGNSQVIRTIGSDYWPLQLQVKFRNADPNGYYVDACIQTIRTGNLTCFMTGFIENNGDIPCGLRREPSFDWWSILFVLLLLCVIGMFAAFFIFCRRCYLSHMAARPRKESVNLIRNPTQYEPYYEPGYHYASRFNHDERLAVIDEVDEKDCISITSSGFGSGHLKSISEDECTRHTDLSIEGRTLTYPSQLSEMRRQSQPLMFPVSSPSMETFKTQRTGSLPSTDHQHLHGFHP